MKTTNQITTCQICARAIKANTGVIAHHGYQRPGNGWQTSSCYGAKYAPYEESRDAIPVCIENYKASSEQQANYAADLMANPPAQITQYARSSYDTDQTFDRPADFDATGTMDGSIYVKYDDGYSRNFRRMVKDAQRNVVEINAAIKALSERYDAWEAK